MVWSPGAVSIDFHDVPQRHRFSMLLSILWLGTQESNAILIKQSFYMNIKFD